MDALLLSPSPEPQNLTAPTPEHLGETVKNKMKPSSLEKRKLEANKKEIMNKDKASSSYSSSSTRRVWRVAHRLRNPAVRLGLARRQAQALAFPLGMSIVVAFTNLGKQSTITIERKSAAGQKKSKLERGVSKVKTELEDLRKAYMFTRIMDSFVLSVLNVLVSMGYGAYVFSQRRITYTCEPPLWWELPSKNRDFKMLICRPLFWFMIYFAVLNIFLVTYLIFRRSSVTKQTMPVTFTLLFLGIVCGLPGKFCVDTLGGNGKLWLFLWGTSCLLQFVANVFTVAMDGLMYGPINVTKSSTMIPYWARRVFFFGMIIMVLPMINGLLPFATFGEWRDHFSLALHEFLGILSHFLTFGEWRDDGFDL